MSDDYLWDRTGRPDPEVERLERLLSRFHHRGQAPELPQQVLEFRPRPYWAVFSRVAAVAAMVLLAAAGTWLVTRRPKPPAAAAIAPRPQPLAPESSSRSKAAWDVASLAGAPKVVTARGANTIAETGRLGVGEWLETDASSRAKIQVGLIGSVQVEPNTRVRLLETRMTEHRLALARGTISAVIWAPPRLFFVETPSAVAVDLGCAYTLEVDDHGAGRLRVSKGWVGFEYRGRESLIPAGAMCLTRPGVGPGTPFYEETSESFRKALARLDFEEADPSARLAALKMVLAESDYWDTLTLWHLLPRVQESERVMVYDRMAQLVPPPRGVTREGILAGDRPMLERWWDQLGLGQTSWWKLWKQPWPEKK